MVPAALSAAAVCRASASSEAGAVSASAATPPIWTWSAGSAVSVGSPPPTSVMSPAAAPATTLVAIRVSAGMSDRAASEVASLVVEAGVAGVFSPDPYSSWPLVASPTASVTVPSDLSCSAAARACWRPCTVGMPTAAPSAGWSTSPAGGGAVRPAAAAVLAETGTGVPPFEVLCDPPEPVAAAVGLAERLPLSCFLPSPPCPAPRPLPSPAPVLCPPDAGEGVAYAPPPPRAAPPVSSAAPNNPAATCRRRTAPVPAPTDRPLS